MNTLNLALIGYGKMGQAIERLAKAKADSYKIAGVYCRSDTSIADTVRTADLIIDFSSPSLTESVIQEAVAFRKPLLIGTTGLSPEILLKVKEAASHIPICLAPNTSLAVTVLSMVSETVGKLLGEEYDVEILETHHRDKVDAPSGTALMLGQSVAKGRGQNLEDVTTYPRQDKRKQGNIGFAVSRGGGVFGEHSVRFLGDHDILELSHKAMSRDLFAKGALVLGKILIKKPKGLYSPSNLLYGAI